MINGYSQLPDDIISTIVTAIISNRFSEVFYVYKAYDRVLDVLRTKKPVKILVNVDEPSHSVENYIYPVLVSSTVFNETKTINLDIIVNDNSFRVQVDENGITLIVR